ncbi:MAG: hypothetical protein AABY64_05140 [Bdellovibrionota bacterium]
MKKLALFLVLGFVCIGHATEILKESGESKVMYKGLKKVLGAVCADTRCLVMAGPVSCITIKNGNDYASTCKVTRKHHADQIYTILGSQARSMFHSLAEFKKPTCQTRSCITMASSVECTSYGVIISDYRCRAEVED